MFNFQNIKIAFFTNVKLVLNLLVVIFQKNDNYIIGGRTKSILC